MENNTHPEDDGSLVEAYCDIACTTTHRNAPSSFVPVVEGVFQPVCVGVPQTNCAFLSATRNKSENITSATCVTVRD